MAQVEGIVEKTLVKKSLDRNIGTIALDNSSKPNVLGAALIEELLVAQCADKVIIELNAYHSPRLREISDLLILPTPPHRTPTPIHDPLDRPLAFCDLRVGAGTAVVEEEGREPISGPGRRGGAGEIADNLLFLVARTRRHGAVIEAKAGIYIRAALR
jgi:acyl-CoA hydrolase